MPGQARPTPRCLREDLALAVPYADTSLEDVSHPLFAKVSDRFAADETPQERISACPSGQRPPKNTFGPPSWIQPRARNFSTSNHEPVISCWLATLSLGADHRHRVYYR